MARLSNILKNIFILLIILQFIPAIIKSFKKHYITFFEPHTKVGVVVFNQTLNSSTPYTKQLKEFFENPEIKAILLKMDCPGGAGGTSQAIYYTIKELKRTWSKPVIALIENICTSAGYYVAMNADWIIGPASCMVGSIGVYMAHPQLKEFIEQYKAKYEIIQGGEYKTAGNPFVETTPKQYAMLKEVIDDVQKEFTKDVALCRNLKLEEQEKWAEGRLFTGNQGLKLGLIDEIGSLEAAEKAIRQKAAVEGKIIWVKAPTPSPFARFFGRDEGPESDESLFESITTSLQSWWHKLTMSCLC